MRVLKNILKGTIPVTIVITLLAGLMYTTVQQVLRMNANDPQIQMAEDAASRLHDRLRDRDQKSPQAV